MAGRFKRVGLVVLPKKEECQAELINESLSGIAGSRGGQRHERVSSRNRCFGSRDGGLLRKNQVTGSEGIVARE